MKLKHIFLLVLFQSFVSSTGTAKLQVVTTITDFASITREIGGERVKVQALIKGTQDPHFVDAKPSMILKANRADLFILVGLDLEVGWLPTLLTQARNKKIQAGSLGHLDASQFITPKEVPLKADRVMGDVHGGGNPHYFTGPNELNKVAQGIFNRLVKLDPQGKDYYHQQWLKFSQKFKQKSAEWEKKIAPFKDTKVVVYHLSWIYLLDWLGLKRVDALEPKPGISPSPSHVTKLVSKVKSMGVKYIIQEVYHPTNLSKIFAKKSKAKLLILPSMVGAKPEVLTIWEKFDWIIKSFKESTK